MIGVMQNASPLAPQVQSGETLLTLDYVQHCFASTAIVMQLGGQVPPGHLLLLLEIVQGAPITGRTGWKLLEAPMTCCPAAAAPIQPSLKWGVKRCTNRSEAQLPNQALYSVLGHPIRCFELASPA